MMRRESALTSFSIGKPCTEMDRKVAPEKGRIVLDINGAGSYIL